MLDRLKNIAASVFGGEQEEVDRLLALPLNGLRIELKNAFRSQNFSQEQYDDFVKRLSQQEDLSGQMTLVEAAIEDRKVNSSLDIDLSSPAKQLLWAAALTRMMQLGNEPLVHSEIWKQLQETSAVHNEMIVTGRVIYSSLQNDDISVSWGQPGSWFFFNPLKQHINLDLYFSLLSGFEHIRAVNLHEIGHSQLTTEYSPRMKELYEKVKCVLDPKTLDTPEKKKKHQEMSVEEQKELAVAVKEWELRHSVFNVLEDICVNQFAVDTRNSYPQDFGYSLNNVCTYLQGFGEMARGDKDEVELMIGKPKQIEDSAKELEKIRKELEAQQGGSMTPEQAKEFEAAKTSLKEKEKKIEKDIADAKKAVALSRRPLTDAEVNAIKKGEISSELAQKMFDQIPRAGLLAFYEANGYFKGKEDTWKRFRIFPEDVRRTVDVSALSSAHHDSFDYLLDRAVGEKGIKRQQPQAKDHFFGVEHYRDKVAETTRARMEIMDHIWDVYLKPFADVLINDFKNEVEQEANNNGQGQQKPSNSQGQQQGQSGGGQGQSQQGSGQGQSSPGDGGEGQEGGGQPSSGDGNGGGKPKPLSESLKDKIGNMQQSPEQQREADRHPGNDNQGNQPGKGDAQQDQEQAGGGDGWGQDSAAEEDQSKETVGDLRQQDTRDGQMTQEEKEAMKEAAQSMQKPGKEGLSMQGGTGRGLDLAKLAKGDWKDFDKRVLELSPIINSVAAALKQIRDAQKKKVMRQSKSLDYMAEDGDVIGRMDRDKILDTKRKQVQGAPLRGDDFKKFQEDAVHVNYSTIEFYQMIDGSGSMPMLRLTGDTTAMEAALQSAVIMYMACRKAGIDAYIMMWGDRDPVIIARPDSELKKVGELLETLRSGTGSGTDLAPGLEKSVLEMAEHVNKNGTISGSSHIQVYSDGDIADSAATQRDLETIARNGKNLTVDVAVLRPPGQSAATAMENTVNAVIESTGTKMIGLMRGHDANVVPKDLAQSLLRRVRRIEVKSEPDSNKRKNLRKLHSKMT